MAETLLDVHSVVRWFVLVGLLVAMGYGFLRAGQNADWSTDAGKPFAWALMLLDIQVLIGLLLWITGRGWELDVFRAWIHPVGMIIALGVGHALAGRAKKSTGANAFRLGALGALAALVIVTVTIPRDAWF